MKPQTHPCDDVVCYSILMVSVTCQKSDKGAALLVCYETRIPCGWDSAAISDFELRFAAMAFAARMYDYEVRVRNVENDLCT